MSAKMVGDAVVEGADLSASGHEGATLLHVTQCLGGGVSRAIELAIEATPEIHHVVLAPMGTLNALKQVHAELIELPDGLLARVKAVSMTAKQVCASALQAHSSWAGFYTRVVRQRVPVLYEPHGFAFLDITKVPPLRAIYWLVERMLVPRTDAALVLSPWEEKCANELRYRLVQRIVNCSSLKSRQRRVISEAQNGTMTIVMAGRIAPQKDPQFFADVARLVDSRVARFIWIGDEGADHPFSAGRQALLDAGVEITGWVEGDTLASLLGRADMYLHTAAWEGFPLSLLDACELGVPCVVRAIPALAGIDLPSFATPEEAASLIMRYTAVPSSLSELVALSAGLAQEHSRTNHDRSVRAAYERVGLFSESRQVREASECAQSGIPREDRASYGK